MRTRAGQRRYPAQAAAELGAARPDGVTAGAVGFGEKPSHLRVAFGKAGSAKMVKPAMRIVRRVSGMEDLHRTELDRSVGEVLPIHAQRYPSFGQHVGRFSVSEKGSYTRFTRLNAVQNQDARARSAAVWKRDAVSCRWTAERIINLHAPDLLRPMLAVHGSFPAWQQ